jgi:predicted DNA-binding transcriptional regulator AlpA
MLDKPVSTPDAARILGCSAWTLWQLFRTGQLDPPALLIGGRYVWVQADIDRARAKLKSRRRAGRPRKGVRA